MKPFQYLEPKDLAEACSLLSKHKDEAKIVAGGQSLLPILKSRLIAPRCVISIKGLLELDYIKEGNDRMRLGALTTHRTIETSPLVKQRFPILVEMEQQLASVQIRNWGTIGGNLCHADPAGDPAPCLIALGAKVKMKSANREREIPLSEFLVDYLESVLEPDEIMVEIEIPLHPPNTGGAFIRKSKTAGSIAIVAVAAVVTLNGETIKDARIAISAVGPTPIRAQQAEKALLAKSTLEEVATIAASEVQPITDIRGSVEFKRDLVKIVTKSAVAEAIKRAQGI